MGWTGLFAAGGARAEHGALSGFPEVQMCCLLPGPCVCRTAHGPWLVGAGAKYRVLSGSLGMHTGVSFTGILVGRSAGGLWLWWSWMVLQDLGGLLMEVSPVGN